jgi:phytoene/squalene synthetase
MANNTDPASYEAIIQEDPETGDLLLPLPQELLDRLGWKEGDDLEWKQSKNGAWVLAKVVK